MLVDFNKKGTVILTHYRSGGTQLRSVIDGAIRQYKRVTNNVGEVDIDFNSIDLDNQLEYIFHPPEGEYSIIQLNNPHTIAYLVASNRFKELLDLYHFVHVERRNKENCVLSLPLWEQFIHAGLYEDYDLWTEENMRNFHNELIEKPIGFNKVYLGNHLPLTIDVRCNPYEYLNLTLTYFVSHINLLRKLTSDFKIHSLEYEVYEEDCTVLHQIYFQDIANEQFLKYLKDRNKKIPYIEKEYVKYYDNKTQEVFKLWNLNNV